MTPTTKTLSFDFLPYSAPNEDLIALCPEAVEVEIHVHHHDYHWRHSYPCENTTSKTKQLVDKTGKTLHTLSSQKYLVKISDYFGNEWVTTLCESTLKDLKVIV